MARARAALGPVNTPPRRVADSLLRQAEENLELVRVGKPAHNVTYADQLLRAALDLVRQAVRQGRLEEAAGGYGGPFLDGFRLPGSPEFDRWADDERRRGFMTTVGSLTPAWS